MGATLRNPRVPGAPLTRLLDGWVARVAGYEPARRNYTLLTELPGRMRSHAEGLRESARRARRLLAEARRAALEASGVAPLVEAFRAARGRLAESESALSAAENRRVEVDRELADLAAGEALDLSALAEELRRLGETELMKHARATRAGEDDALVATLGGVRQEASRLDDRSRRLAEDRRGLLGGIAGVAQIRRRFREKYLDAAEFAFDDPGELHATFECIERGLMTPDEAWRWLTEQQRRGSGGGLSGASDDGAGDGVGSVFDSLGKLLGGSGSDGGGFGGGDFDLGDPFGGDWFDTGDTF